MLRIIFIPKTVGNLQSYLNGLYIFSSAKEMMKLGLKLQEYYAFITRKEQITLEKMGKINHAIVN